MDRIRNVLLFTIIMINMPLMADEDYQAMAVEILSDLIAIESTEAMGLSTKASEYSKNKLLQYGFSQSDLQVTGPGKKNKGLIAIYHGESSRNPTITMAHLDVVPSVIDSWDTDPYVMTENDGFFYGRGTNDNKAGAAALITNFIRLKHENFIPKNDIIMLLTGDEETQMNGIEYFRDNFDSVKNAAFAMNADGGYITGTMDNPEAFLLQSAEKVYMTVSLHTKNKGGHSSIPRPDNAIYELANALKKLENFQFPISFNETTKQYLKFAITKESKEHSEKLRQLLDNTENFSYPNLINENPDLNAQLRTTCVATRLSGGHANNALPVSASATINCRVLPQEEPQKIVETIKNIIGNDIEIDMVWVPEGSPPSPITSSILNLIANSLDNIFPTVAIVPYMSTGATDAQALRNIGIPVYGTGGIMTDPSGFRAHGLNERIEISAFHSSLDFWYESMKQL
ncbi:MAG: M20/M25/M40 family metallo-hydrolase [Gammaproteobacteria bacterium]|nr:M20/M25/M40 family metallo-hydrolase [Gammaproteobacteria bacterium]